MPRACPRCSFALAPTAQRALHGGTTTIDVCPRCNGAWFDAGEAKALFGENTEPSTWERASAARHLGPRRLACPVGHGWLTGYAIPVAGATEVEVDVCPACMGMWLDAWEGARLAQATRDVVKSGGAVPASAQKTGVGWYLFQLFTALPVEEYNPVRRRPVVCIALIVANALAFIVEIVQPNPERFIQTFGVVPAYLAHGWNLWSIVTHMFMHGGIAHIAFNMWFLYTFGDNVEDRVGRARFLVLYLAFGFCAMLAQVAMTLGSEQPLVGASGAIAGLMGAYLVLFPKTRVYQVILFIRLRLPVWLYLLVWVGLQFVAGFMAIANHQGSGVAWWAHIGGFAAGALWGALNRNKYGEVK